MPRSVSASIRSMSNPPKYSGCIICVDVVVEDFVDESLDDDDGVDATGLRLFRALAPTTSCLLVTKASPQPQPITNAVAA